MLKGLITSGRPARFPLPLNALIAFSTALLRFDREQKKYVPRDLPLDKPLDDGKQKFFINKQGDIMELSIKEQSRFLRNYYKWRNRKGEKWRVEEYKPEAFNGISIDGEES